MKLNEYEGIDYHGTKRTAQELATALVCCGREKVTTVRITKEGILTKCATHAQIGDIPIQGMTYAQIEAILGYRTANLLANNTRKACASRAEPGSVFAAEIIKYDDYCTTALHAAKELMKKD